MKALIVAAMLVAACRGDRVSSARKDAGRDGPASAVSASAVPKLPRSEDGIAALARLDRRLAQLDAARERATSKAPDSRALSEAITLRLDRAAIRGRVEDYEQALADSALFVERAPNSDIAWRLRITALMRAHELAAARDALNRLAPLVYPSQLVEHEVALADATGDTKRALAGRAQIASEFPSPQNLTLWAIALAQAGRFDEATALVPKAAAAVRDNPPLLLAWLLFQWGRIYELKGEHATARDLFAAAHARLPGYVEPTAHLAQAMIATGDTAAARPLVDEALAANRHPELLALAVQLGRRELLAEARTAWERYVSALPLAFSDHAARFYLGVGANPARALELARINQRNRDTHEARALLVEAALAAGDEASACAVVDPLVSGTRAQQFIAWRALSRCGRSGDAERLARELGITP